jgi:hypothetical protein
MMDLSELKVVTWLTRKDFEPRVNEY